MKELRALARLLEGDVVLVLSVVESSEEKVREGL